jgi:ribonuclease-3 family protein
VEETVKFDQFQLLAHKTFGELDAAGVPVERFDAIPAERLHPLVLAYIGDAFFNLYVRTRLLRYEQSKVRVLHGHGSKMVSATLQAYALKQLEPELTPGPQRQIDGAQKRVGQRLPLQYRL